MGFVNEAIEDGVGEGWFVDDIVSDVKGQLAGYDGRTRLILVFDDFHQVAALRCGQPIRPQIFQDQHIYLG